MYYPQYVPQHKNVIRMLFWQHLKQLNSAIDLPWCLMGTLSEMLLPSNKIGGTLLHFPNTKDWMIFFLLLRELMQLIMTKSWWGKNSLGVIWFMKNWIEYYSGKIVYNHFLIICPLMVLLHVLIIHMCFWIQSVPFSWKRY